MSNKIPVSDFIAEFEIMRDGKWKYEWGAARKGCVDCSGAFVYASKKLGGPSISHSSNQIPRKNMTELLPISEAKPGYAVLRHSDKFETEALAKKYNDGLGNFKHIGLVSRDGKHVLEAKGSNYGFAETKLTDSWHCCGPLTFIDYGEEVKEETMPDVVGTYYVNVGKDSWLNVRADHGTNKKVLRKLYLGDQVEVIDVYDNWYKIIFDGGTETGWVYSKYLVKATYGSYAGSGEESEYTGVEYEEKIEIRTVITDSEGNTFYPSGGLFTVNYEIFIDGEPAVLLTK